MPGLGGGLARALGSDNVSVTSKVKNSAIQGSIDQALGNYKQYTSGEQSALSDYISKYLGQQGDFAKNVGQESGAIGRFYTGDMANKLAQLRSQRESAVNAAADVGVKQALASVDRSRLGQQGGSSSYDQRLAIGAVTPIRTQAALDTANQARSDLGYVTQNQLGLVGQRENLSNALAGYGLVPYATASGIQNRDLQTLGGITNLDQANKFYGLKKDKNTFADISDTIDSSMLNAMSVYGSMYGGGKSGSSYGGGAARGGLVDDYDWGGPVRGPGTTHSDSIPIHVSRGEYIIPASAVRIPGVLPMLTRIRAAGLATEGRRMGPMATEIETWKAGGWREPHNNYAGGGLTDISHDLMARASEDQNWTWPAATFVPESGGWGMPSPSQASPMPTRTGMPIGMGRMPRNGFSASSYLERVYGPEAVPSNFSTLTPDQQRDYSMMYERARGMEMGWAGTGNPYE